MWIKQCHKLSPKSPFLKVVWLPFSNGWFLALFYPHEKQKSKCHMEATCINIILWIKIVGHWSGFLEKHMLSLCRVWCEEIAPKWMSWSSLFFWPKKMKGCFQQDVPQFQIIRSTPLPMKISNHFSEDLHWDPVIEPSWHISMTYCTCKLRTDDL